MTLEYTVTLDDYLIHYLYMASQSKRIKRRRCILWLFLPLINTVLSIMFFLSRDFGSLLVFAGIAIIWLVFYPVYSKFMYKRHYHKIIKENYGNMAGKKTVLSLEDGFIKTANDVSEAKVLISEIEGMYEIDTHYFVASNLKTSLILPKIRINKDELETFIQKLHKEHSVPFHSDKKWKWK